MTETVAAILSAHRTGAMTPAETIERSFARARRHNDPALFINLRSENEVVAEAEALAAEGRTDQPLYGVPVAIKDNIDVQGMPTTAACPAFAYQPDADATCVARLRRAGAIIIGKTNLDQFATGLNGTRSPYGTPRNALRPELIPGGSSSGSAVAVAAGIVPLSLGTDTAGSGRVPAMMNNIVGLKPSLGLISTHGVVPACRTLDCVSVFALTTDDAWHALTVIAGPDADPYSRDTPVGALSALMNNARIGVPSQAARVFFGDKAASEAYSAALDRLERLGVTVAEIDIEPFYETARLLYEGPWVAERLTATRALLASSPESIHPAVREIVTGAGRVTGADTFMAFYKLQELRRVADHVFRQVDALALPTAPTVYTVEQMLSDPIALNSRLGTYTNFTNLLDFCGLAVPASMRDDRTPFGITLLAPHGHDARLASLGRLFHADTALSLGGLGITQPPLRSLPDEVPANEIALAVVGAHLSGMALNHELRSAGARLIETAATAADYRLYALSNNSPPKPGLLHVGVGQGKAIEVEIWGLSAEAFGRFVALVPAPLSIGTVRLDDGRAVKGFLVEAFATEGERDISQFGGWRSYVTQTSTV